MRCDATCSSTYIIEDIDTYEELIKSLYSMLQTHAVVLQRLNEANVVIDSLTKENIRLHNEVKRVSHILMSTKTEQYKLLATLKENITEETPTSSENTSLKTTTIH